MLFEKGETMNLRTYRVWLSDGSAILVEAESTSDAWDRADQQCEVGQCVERAECLDKY